MSSIYPSASWSWSNLSIKYKILLVSASLITLRLFLNGNYFLGYKQVEKYHEFQHQVNAASTEIYHFKSNFTEIFFTNGALPQIEQTRKQLDNIITTFSRLHQKHGDDTQFHLRIIDLEERAEQMKITVEYVLQAPQMLTLNNPEGMIVLGRVTAISNHLFGDVQRLIDDVTLYSGKMRDEIFGYMLTMGMVIFSIGILFLVMLYRGVMGPLKLLDEMRSLIQRVRTEGDLSSKLRGESNTEVGRLARDFNELLGSLDENLGKTSRTVSLVAEHVERLSHEVRQSHENVNLQQHEIFHLSNAIRKMAETLQTLSENTNALCNSVSELEQHADDGEEQVAAISRLNRQLGEHLDDARQQLQTLQESYPETTHHNTVETIRPAGDTISRLQYYSKEAANSIESASIRLGEQLTTLANHEHTAHLIHRFTESVERCSRLILSSIEQEREVLGTINRDIDEITAIERQAAFTSSLITSASDELLYLSKLLSVEVQRFHPSNTPPDAERLGTG